MFIQDHHRQSSTNDRYNDLLLAATDDESMPYEDFNEAIKKAEEETPCLISPRGVTCSSSNKTNHPIDERNQLIHALRSSVDLSSSIVNAMHDALSCLNKHAKDKVLIAKARWAAHLCSKIHDMVMNPRVGWLHCPSQEVSHNCHENTGRQRCHQLERKHVCLWIPL